MIMHCTDCWMMMMLVMMLRMITIGMMVKAAEHSSVQCSVRRLHWGAVAAFSPRSTIILFIVIIVSITHLKLGIIVIILNITFF